LTLGGRFKVGQAIFQPLGRNSALDSAFLM